MTDSYTPVPPTSGATGSEAAGGKADVAKEQASQMKDQVVDSGGDVVDAAKSGAADVVGEAKTQAKDLLHQTQAELREQAETQQRRVAHGLRSISEEFSDMAKNSSQQGVASDLVEQAASRAGSVASWLDGRDPGSLLAEVRRFASRKPGTFIAGAAIAGVLVGRLTRSVASVASEESDAASSAPSSANNAGAQNEGTAANTAGARSDGSVAPAFDEVVEPTPTPLYSSLAGDQSTDSATTAEFSDAAQTGFSEPEGRS
jgi:polyhydroxyalkanoate synthesis regulator phasin